MTLDLSLGPVGITGDPRSKLLLIPGAGESGRVFAPLIERLPGAFALDLPGHGETTGEGFRDIGDYASWISRVLEEAHLAPPWIGGHSMGGAVALKLALDGPYRPLGLCLIGSGGRLRVHPDILNGLREGQIPDAFRRAMIGPGAPLALVEEAVRAPSSMTLGDFVACDGFDVLDRLGEIRLPLLAVVGDEDRYTPVKYARAVTEATGGTLEVIAGAGHLLPLENPSALAAAIARHVPYM